MKLQGRMVVEPLDEERLTNIERRVVSGAVDAAARGLRAPRRFAGRALAVAAVITAGVVGWALHGQAPGAVVAEPAMIRVDTSPQHAMLDIGDAQIASDPDTAFAVTRPGGGVLVAMTRGKVELEVGKRGGRPPLIVRAGDTDVVVVGTRFSVDVGDGHGDVDVRVTEGVVRVVHQQQETRVAAGDAWHTKRGRIAGGATRQELIADAATPAGSGMAANAGAGREPASAVRTGEASETREAGGDEKAGVAPALLHDRKAAVPGARPTTTQMTQSTTTRATPARPVSPARPSAAARDPNVDLRSAIRSQRVEPALAIDEPSAAAAVARYYDIAAHQSGDAASQAFYSIAVVRHLRLGLHAEALQTLDAYVRRFPGGKEYRAALWLRVRILCLDKLDDRCRAAAYTFVHEAPDAAGARVAELITLGE